VSKFSNLRIEGQTKRRKSAKNIRNLDIFERLDHCHVQWTDW
jgi:hypothetical protein